MKRTSTTVPLIVAFAVILIACSGSTEHGGQYLVYSASSDETSVNIYLVNVDSLEKKQITIMEYANYPSWSSDGRKIVFSSTDGLYFTGVDNTGLTKIIDTINFEIHPIWSPDDSKISFISQNTEEPSLYDLMVVNIDGSGLITIASNLGEIDYFSSFSWSPDGKKIAFSHPSGESREIVTINANGSELTQITNLSTPSYSPPIQPSWSPDGNKIAFVTWDLFIINADGTGLNKLVDKEAQGFSALGAPQWSPDGKYIACQNGDNIILVSPANGQITTIAGEYSIVGYSWSSQGDELAYFVFYGNGVLGIETINLDSMQKTQIVGDLGFYPWQSLVWQP